MLKELPYTVGDQDLIDERWNWNRIGKVMIGVMIKWDDEKFDRFFNIQFKGFWKEKRCFFGRQWFKFNWFLGCVGCNLLLTKSALQCGASYDVMVCCHTGVFNVNM